MVGMQTRCLLLDLNRGGGEKSCVVEGERECAVVEMKKKKRSH